MKNEATSFREVKLLALFTETLVKVGCCENGMFNSGITWKLAIEYKSEFKA